VGREVGPKLLDQALVDDTCHQALADLGDIDVRLRARKADLRSSPLPQQFIAPCQSPEARLLVMNEHLLERPLPSFEKRHWTPLGGDGKQIAVTVIIHENNVRLTRAAVQARVSPGDSRLAAGERFPKQDVLPYVVSQFVGAVIAAAALYAIATGSPTFDLAKGFAANEYGAHSPGQYSLISGVIAEVVLTMMFLFIIMGATHGKAPVGFAPIAIGWGLTLIHFVGIPITNTSVNPARRPGQVRGHSEEGSMMPSLAQVIVWVIVGLIGGSLAGLIIMWKRRGFGPLQNLGMGLVGAFVGCLLFRLLERFPRLDAVAISLRDIVAAVAGTSLVLAVLWIGHWSRAGATAPESKTAEDSHGGKQDLPRAWQVSAPSYCRRPRSSDGRCLVTELAQVTTVEARHGWRPAPARS
jgi:uncharacterized membrane protein YeaQ/YmgE (transglycosylase-associated protein family)